MTGIDLSRRSLLPLAVGFWATASASTPVQPRMPWWKSSVFYEIYPRSFQDGNSDGIGDFIGMKDRLEYLAELGVDAIWVAADRWMMLLFWRKKPKQQMPSFMRPTLIILLLFRPFSKL